MGCTVSRSVYIIEDGTVEGEEQKPAKTKPGTSYLGTRRRHSDVSLRTILLDPTIYQSFREFLQGQLCEEVFLFWIEVDQYNKIEKAKLKREKAAHIYDTYIRPGAAQRIDLDQDTRDAITKTLMYSKERVTQSDPAKMCVVFDLAHAKTFTQLKFEFMPQFLTSKAFSKISSSNSDSEGAVGGGQLASEGHVVELKHCMKHPVIACY